MTDRDTLLESQRLTAVRGLQLLDSQPEVRFDRIARLAGAVFDMPIALITMVDAGRVWWKSAFGLPGLREVPREGSCCSAVVDLAESGAGLVTDPTKDCRFKKHLLTVDHQIRFYAGQPLFSKGHGIGTLAVLDRRPRDFLPSQQRMLADLAIYAEQEMRSIGLRDALERLAAAERRAEDQHKRFAAFMDHLPNAAFIKDAEGHLFYLNPCYQRTFGIEPQSVLGKRDEEWLPHEVAERTMRADRMVIETGQASVTPETIPTREGVRNWLTFRFPIPAGTGERLLGGVAIDMTAQTQTERALQELAMLQRAVLDTTSVAIISTEVDGTIRTFNAGSERLLGYRAREVVGKTTPTLFHDPAEVKRLAAEHPPEPASEAAPIRWGAEQLAAQEAEWIFLRKDGKRFPANLHVTALRDGAGAVTGYVGVIHDLAEQRHSEAALAAAQARAEADRGARAQFVSDLGEEVRTPLQGILGVTALLLGADLPPDHRQLAELVQSSAAGLLATVDDAAELTRDVEGRLALAAIDFDPRQVLRSIVEFHAARANERCVVVEIDVAAEVPLHLSGDPQRLRQVLNHLVAGAVKQSARAKVVVSLKVQEKDGEDVVVVFAVTHHEDVQVPEKQGHSFHSFTPADESEETGFGLLFCRQWIDRMGGMIGSESAPGRGSRFFFTARLRRASRAAGELGPVAEPLRAQLRVLLAEDSAIHRLVATRQLQRAGCVIAVVEDGQQAVDAVTAGHFDLVLMDCEMPRLSGYEATREIRRREGAEGHTRIVALTAEVLPGERERCLALGLDGYLAKPIRAAELDVVLAETQAQIASSAALAGTPAHEPVDRGTLSELRRECEEAWPGLFAEYVQIFQEDAERARAVLRGTDGLPETARSLRGSAANFGAGRLILLCDQLEYAASEDREKIGALVPKIIAELARVEAALLTALAGPRASRRKVRLDFQGLAVAQ